MWRTSSQCITCPASAKNADFSRGSRDFTERERVHLQEFEIQFVHQRRGLQRVVRGLPPHLAGGQALQLGIESFDELFGAGEGSVGGFG